MIGMSSLKLCWIKSRVYDDSLSCPDHNICLMCAKKVQSDARFAGVELPLELFVKSGMRADQAAILRGA